MVAIDEQSPDIAQGVDESFEAQHGDTDPIDRIGAGDQGMMFGYATHETEELMPLPIMLAHKLAKRLAAVRKADVLPYLRPDGKTQVTVRYEIDEHGIQRPVEIERVLVSTQHRDGLDAETLIKPDLLEHVVEPILHADYRGLYDQARLGAKDFFYVNPTGKFVIGGPMGDTGLTGRKIIVDTYGGAAPHGGGAFSGKDPTKVDRSAAYAARYVAKNVVAAGLADRCQVQVAYAIGVAHPMSVLVDTFGTEAEGLSNERISELVGRALRPAPRRDRPRPRPPPPDLREDRRVRPLRPYRLGRLHVGAHRQGRCAPCRGGARRSRSGLSALRGPACGAWLEPRPSCFRQPRRARLKPRPGAPSLSGQVLAGTRWTSFFAPSVSWVIISSARFFVSLPFSTALARPAFAGATIAATRPSTHLPFAGAICASDLPL